MQDVRGWKGRVLTLALLACSMAPAACTAPEALPEAVEAVPAPAEPGAGEPNLFAAADGTVYLSWLAPAGEGRTALRYAVWQGAAWGEARTIAEGPEWFVNWADFPAMVAFDDGSLAAHFLSQSGAGPYAYDVQVTRTAGPGRPWSPPVTPHDDSTATEHGFVSLVPWDDGRLLTVWLDGRQYADTTHAHAGMSLRAAFLDPEGRRTGEAVLDDHTCDCCQTAAVRTSTGALVAYRDRTGTEIRDISLVRLVDGQWTAPQPLHHDGWRIEACPVNGPALAAEGDRVAAAWFTAAQDSPRVYVAFSNDGGASFGAPVQVDEGAPLGRVDVVMLAGGEGALVSWLEGEGEGRVLVRRVVPGSMLEPPLLVTRTSTARASGFPRMARAGRTLLFAWTEAGDPARLRTARALLE